MKYKEFYRRHLPHWQPRGTMMFLTYRLAETIPQQKLKSLIDEYDRRLSIDKTKGVLSHEKKIQVGKWLFVEIDKILDMPQYGPTWLTNSNVAEMIVGNLHYHAQR